MKTDIYVCTHKLFLLPEFNNGLEYKIVDCGETDADFYLHGNIGDNIAEKGVPFSELRHIYWIWKNQDLNDYVGICHYRRHFKFNLEKTPEEIAADEQLKKEIEASGEVFIPDTLQRYATPQAEIEANVNDNSIIAPYPITLAYNGEGITNKDNYEYIHNPKDLQNFIDTINESFPQLKSAMEEMLQSNKFYCNYMFIMKKEMFKEYCELLFNVLDAFLKKYNFNTVIDYARYASDNIDKCYSVENILYKDSSVEYDLKQPLYQCRFPAFVFERFLHIFILYKHLNVHHVGRVLKY